MNRRSWIRPSDRRRVRDAALLLVAGLLIAGCSDGDGGVGAATPEISATAVPSPMLSATPPRLPSAAPTPASAVAFVRYFWDAYNYAYATQDAGPLAASSATTCEFCGSVISDVRAVAQDGGQSTGGTVTVIEAVPPTAKITAITLVTASVSQKPASLKLLLKPAKIDPGWKRLRTDFALSWNGTRWFVTGVDADTAHGQPWPS